MEQIPVKIKGKVFRWEITERDATCQKCGYPIHWTETHNGKPAPVDIQQPDTELTTCHYDTCERR